MSEIATAAAVPVVAPAAAPETAAAPQVAVETPAPTQPQQPATAIEARRRLSERMRAAREPAPAPVEAPAEAAPTGPVVDALGNLHDPTTGKFAPKEGEPATPAAETATGTPTPPAEAAAPTTPEVAPGAAPEGFVQIALPDGHPLRDEGLSTLTVSAEQERAVRALLNNPVRRREVEEATRAALDWRAEAQAQAAAAEALRQQLQAAMSGTGLSAEHIDRLRELEAYDPIAAEAYRRYVVQEMMEPVDGAVDAARQQAQAQAAQQMMAVEAGQMAAEFTGRIVQEARVPLWGEAQLRGALQEFGARVAFFEEQLGQPVRPTYEDWLQFVTPRYAADPRVQHAMGEQWAAHQQAEAARIQREAAEAQKRSLEEAARNAGANKLGQLRGGVQGIAVPAVGAVPQPSNAYEAKKSLRARFSAVG